MKKYILTIIGAVLAMDILLVTLLADIDLFEEMVELLERYEEYEVDEFIIPAFIFLLFAFIDFIQAQIKQ